MNTDEKRIAVVDAAAAIGMSANGLMHTLMKRNALIRDDGHWFCTESTLESIRQARLSLGKPIRQVEKRKRFDKAEQTVQNLENRIAELTRKWREEQRSSATKEQEIATLTEQVQRGSFVIFTRDEIETIRDLIEDWGFEYGLKADRKKVGALGKKLHIED